MEYIIKLNEQQIELLKSILTQIEPEGQIYTPSVKPKKLTKKEQRIQYFNEYLARKAERKRKK